MIDLVLARLVFANSVAGVDLSLHRRGNVAHLPRIAGHADVRRGDFEHVAGSLRRIGQEGKAERAVVSRNIEWHRLRGVAGRTLRLWSRCCAVTGNGREHDSENAE